MVFKIRFGVVFLISVLLSGVVNATDLGLVIGNRNYQRAGWMYGAETALNSARALRQDGYFVISGRDVTLDQSRQALETLNAKMPEAEHVVVLLNGHFVHSDSQTWFLPVDAREATLASVAFDGLPLSVLLNIVAQRPGQAAVFLGTAPRNLPLGPGLEAGFGALEIPQGVFVATGRPDDVDLSLRRDFLGSGLGFADALAAAPGSVTGMGFVSNVGSLQAISSGGSDPEAVEDGYWNAVADLNTVKAMQAYLRAYPNGKYVGDAEARIDTIKTQTVEEKAREAEADLELDREERRHLQEALTLLGYDTRGVDGIFGRGTRSAIAAWQKDQGVPDTGYFKRRHVTLLLAQADARARDLAREAREKQKAQEQEDRAYWRSSGARDNDPKGLRRYLRRYPDGLFAEEAQKRLDQIAAENANRISDRERKQWERAEETKAIGDYMVYLDRYPNGAFAEDAKARIAELEDLAARKAEIDAAAQEEASMNMNILARVLVEKQLTVLGFDSGPADGNFDKATRKALRKFQRSRGFPVTGYLTRQTLVRLIAEAKGG
jgi:peptidoglycan hydrolase-like protein with peptidoglycan-binding domain